MKTSNNYDCIRNTYHFHFSQAQDIRGGAGLRDQFIFNIPQLPLFDRNESKTAIFTLRSMSIGGQTDAINIPLNDVLFVQIDGLSIRPQCVVGGFNVNRFMIPNKFPDGNIDIEGGGDDTTMKFKSGGELNNPYHAICGNPTGNTQIRVSVFDEINDPITENAIGNMGALTFNLVFSVELITPQQDQNL